MAFAIRNLAVLQYANGFTLWHYKGGKDPLSEINGANYFGNAADMLRVGDMLMINGCDGATIRVVQLAEFETVVTAPLT